MEDRICEGDPVDVLRLGVPELLQSAREGLIEPTQPLARFEVLHVDERVVVKAADVPEPVAEVGRNAQGVEHLLLSVAAVLLLVDVKAVVDEVFEGSVAEEGYKGRLVHGKLVLKLAPLVVSEEPLQDLLQGIAVLRPYPRLLEHSGYLRSRARVRAEEEVVNLLQRQGNHLYLEHELDDLARHAAVHREAGRLDAVGVAQLLLQA
mmetsp:Transcript_11330/g.26869  ORF Transcript_11330/g.26869 Transcript_11330/m.26869 type:complete len:206 (-) Transcript_11330:284-901(-)